MTTNEVDTHLRFIDEKQTQRSWGPCPHHMISKESVEILRGLTPKNLSRFSSLEQGLNVTCSVRVSACHLKTLSGSIPPNQPLCPWFATFSSLLNSWIQTHVIWWDVRNPLFGKLQSWRHCLLEFFYQPKDTPKLTIPLYWRTRYREHFCFFCLLKLFEISDI